MNILFDAQGFQSARKAKKYSQMKLAELLETSDRYIRALEAGRKANPSAILLYKACLVLDQPTNAFLTVITEEQHEEY